MYADDATLSTTLEITCVLKYSNTQITIYTDGLFGINNDNIMKILIIQISN